MLSVMLLCYKRPAMLKATLDSYLECHNDFPHKLYIQVNCKTPAVRELLEEYKPELKYLEELKYNEKNLGLSVSTNYFWGKVDTEYLVKIDSDALFQHDFLKLLYNAIVSIREVSDAFFCIHAQHRHAGEPGYHGDGVECLTVNGVKIVPAPHGGGICYIAHKPTILKLGKIAEGGGTIYGWTQYQHSAKQRGHRIAYLKGLRCEHLGYGDEFRNEYPEYFNEIWKARGH